MKAWKSKGSEASMRYWSLYLYRAVGLLLAFAMMATAGCAKRTVMPDSKGYDLERLMVELKGIESIEAALEVELERGDSLMNGDVFIRADEKKMTLRFYYMGFLAGEITEDEGIVKGSVKIGKARSEMLAEGLKKSIFWWRLEYEEVVETETSYILRGSGRQVSIDKNTLLPFSQRIELANGESVDITYSEPAKTTESISWATDWHHSLMTIEYRTYKVKARITDLKIYRGIAKAQ